MESKSVVYSLQATGNHNNLPVTCVRWKPDVPDQQYGNVLIATCKFKLENKCSTLPILEFAHVEKQILI